MWDRSQKQKRLQQEQKAIQRKALRQGSEIRGRDLARLRRVSGTIYKESQYETEEFEDDN